ncbi:MAG: riboflavin biosynthesis protein RibF [Bacilli bacterium]|nr:riboflavin biosynthesis protein RibF [Bacilli bacterium]
MKVIHFDKTKEMPKGAALLLGDFDGVHLGHQELVKAALSFKGVPHAALLFDQDPSFFLDNGKSKKILTSLADKISLFEEYGLDTVYIIHVDPSFFALSPEEFIANYLEPIEPSVLISGSDYRFGKKASGDVSLLGKHFKLKTVDLLFRQEKKIASRDIKNYIASGQIEEANAELGRLYSLRGVIHEGFHNGRKIGFPTINLHLEESYLLPSSGVYLTETTIDGITYPSITNVGSNPTVGLLHHERVESYLKGYSGPAYGKNAVVAFKKKFREQRKFASLGELKAQLEKDKNYLE